MSLVKLAKDHAYWADKVRDLYRQSQQICCSRSQPSGRTCINKAFEETRDHNLDCHYDEYICYEEVWQDMVAAGEVCGDCKKHRELKKQRMYARRRLGVIRGAITRVGRTIMEDGDEDGH